MGIMLKLIVFSDPVCPWCYIGKGRLDRALAQRPGHPFEVEYHPFQLNPDFPPEGMARTAYLERLFGPGGEAKADAQVGAEAEATGLAFAPEKMNRMPNTLDAHRLMHWAALEGKQAEITSALFHANFAEGRDISNHKVLADIAEANGMERDVVARLLASDADRDDLIARDEDARQKGVRAVPTYVIAGQHVVSGAQPTEMWLNVIDQVSEQLAAQPDSTPGETC
jgi:predicted DsbA family dithiol-disulfide isomerase